MKTLLSYSIVLLFALSSHSILAQFKSDYDKKTDFTQFKTYSFAGWVKDSDKQINEFDQKRILDAFKAELDARGLSHVKDSADLHITLFVVLDNKTSTTAYTDFNGTMGYRGRWGWGMGAGGMASATTTYVDNDYIEGTLVIDMYDADTKDLTWQGVITTSVKENPEKRAKSIPKKVKKLMKKFPVAIK